jgi:mannose-6-phosphate isomerase-like protein (cupin superfamily)
MSSCDANGRIRAEWLWMPLCAPPLRDGRLASDGLVVVEWRDDGGTSAERPIAGLHVHHEDDEAWYVLEGTLGFRRGDELIDAPAGSAVLVPRGVAHSYWNAGSKPARYVLVMTPRIAALIDELHRPDAAGTWHDVFRRHASELLTG